MHLKVFVKLKKTLKNPLVRAKKSQNTQKKPKTKKTHWAGFFFLKPVFFPTLFIMMRIRSPV
jgi:hypothetical protein